MYDVIIFFVIKPFSPVGKGRRRKKWHVQCRSRCIIIIIIIYYVNIYGVYIITVVILHACRSPLKWTCLEIGSEAIARASLIYT